MCPNQTVFFKPNYLNSSNLNFFQTFESDILNCLQVGRREKMYSPRIRTFALTLHFYSPRGYRYVRSVFNKNLPSISTIRKWYSSINGKPGYSKEAFTALRCKALEANREGREMLCCLVFDEISIRKQEEYDHTTDTKTGYVCQYRQYLSQRSSRVHDNWNQ